MESFQTDCHLSGVQRGWKMMFFVCFFATATCPCPVIEGAGKWWPLLFFFQRNGKFSNWPATCLVFKEARKWWPLSVFLLLPPVLWSKGLASNDLYYVSSLPPPVQWSQGMASDDLCCVSFLLPPVQCSKGLASNNLYYVSLLPPPVQDHRGWQVMTFVVFICYHHHQFVLRKNKTLWNMFFILLLN